MGKTKDKTITIPLALAKLLSARRDEYKDQTQFDEVRVAAEAMLRVLMEYQDNG